MQLGDQFESIKEACDAITCFVLNEGESFHVEKSDKKHFTIICKERCGFRILVLKSSKGTVSITCLKLYTCSLAVYYNNTQAYFVVYFAEYY